MVEQLPLQRPALRVAVVGDIGDGVDKVAAGIARVHAAAPLDAVIITGDNFYPCGVTSETDRKWDLIRPLTALSIPLYPVLGNHDHCGNAGAQIAATALIPQWRFPAKEYVVHNELADFVMLDTNPYAKGTSRDAEAMLRSALAASRTTWRIVVGHHTIISSGAHGYYPRKELRRMRRLLPILRAEKVDLYACGHDHHLELVGGKPLMLVSGAGSRPIPAVAIRPSTLYPNDPKRALGFAVVELTATSMTISFHAADGKQLWSAAAATKAAASRRTP